MTVVEELPPLHDVNELAAEVGLDAMAAVIHETAKEKGFWPEDYYKQERLPWWAFWRKRLAKREVTDAAIGVKLALVHSEVTEVLEAIRKNQGEEKVVEEMADIIIRLLDTYAALRNTGQVDASLDGVVQLKMKKNEQRPRLHGNNF